MKKFYITFGQVHAHSVSGKTFDKDCVCEIEAENADEARHTALSVFGKKWCFFHDDKPEMSFYSRGIIKL